MHIHSHLRTARYCAFLLSLALLAVTATAGSVISTQSGNWHDPLTWGSTAVTAADDVFVASGHTVTIYGNGVTNINSLSVSGILQHADNSTTEANKIVLDIANDCTIAAGGKINATGRGYENNQGPGRPLGGSYVGGSHGGLGGLAYGGADEAGLPYGSVIAPTNLGSGGVSDASAEGGGAVRLDVGGSCTVNGTINADGLGGSVAAGAGGSVYITAGTFGGSGAISVDGPYGGHGDTGGGGGGRIAVVLTSGSTFGSVTMTAKGFQNGNSGYASAGTIFTKTASQNYGTLKVDGDGVAQYRGDNKNQSTQLPSGMTLQLDSIVVTNGGDLWIPASSTLIVTNFSGSHTSGYLTVEGTLDVPDDFTVPANLVFRPLSGCTLELTNMTVPAGAFVTHIDNKTSEDYTLEIDIPGNLTVEAGASIDVSGSGYRYERYPGGGMVGGDYGMGGSHGGRGGYCSTHYGNDPSYPTYGSITAPTNIGSGGRRFTTTRQTDGGGAMKLTVGGTTTVSGSILADGLDTDLRLNGGGAGGSIWLTTSSLAGSGTISAKGGTTTFVGSPVTEDNSGGGGGRVAVILTGSDSFGDVSIRAPGGGGTHDDGGAGTVYKQTQTQGAGKGALIIDNTGRSPSEAHTDINSSVTDASVGDVIIRNNAHLDIDDNQSITVKGSWSNAASFTAGAGASVWLAGTDEVTMFGDTTFDTLICSNVSKQINFEAGATQDVDNVFTFSGPTDTSLVLRSTSAAQWGLDLDAGVVMNIEYVDVEYSDARPGAQALAGNSKDSNNNDNWNFSAGAAATNIWVGTDNGSWGDGNNWTLTRAPIPADLGVVFSNGNNQATLPSAQTFNNLEVWTGATLSLDNNNLTVGGETIVQGTITASGSETLTFSNLTVSSGTLTAVGSQEIYIAGDVDFTGGTFTEASSHVILNGDVAQSITSGGESFATLTASNQSATVTFADAVIATTYYSRNGDVTYGGNFNATLFDVRSENGAVTHTFEGGSTYTFTEMWLRGTSGNTQHLEGSSAAAWHLNVANVANVQNVNAAYSDAAPGVEIQAISSVDSGNNTNWNFGPFSVWTGASSTDFHTPGNWEPAVTPTNTSYIIVDDTTTCIVDDPATVQYAKIGGVNASTLQIDSSFTVGGNVDVINNGTVEINKDPGMTVSGNVSVASGGLLTHKANSTTEADRMVLTVDGNFTLAAGASIDVEGLGYQGGYGPGKPVSGTYGAGSHGGIGGDYSDGSLAGDPYGSVIAPTNLGSGGAPSGAKGGGAVRLDVGGACTIDGTINADGIAASSAAGAGGSVYITAGTFGGSGTISADGPYSGHGDTGGGGGGRIAVVLTNGSTFGSVTMTAAAYPGGNIGYASAGTIFTKTASQSYGTLKVDGDGVAQHVGDNKNKSTELPSGTTLQVDSIAVTNGGNLWVPSGATLIVSDFTPSHTSGYLAIEGTLDLPDDFTVSNLTFMPHPGCTLDVTNLTISPSARVTHYNNRTSEEFSLEIDIPGDLTIESGASIDVSARGYRYSTHPDGTFPGSGYWGPGGSHGGRGGHGSPNYGSDPSYATYGSITAPTNIGSGGYGHSGTKATDGGGAIKITVGGTTTVSGSILADGADTAGLLNGGGAGGSIWLTTSSMAGSGTIRANGGISSYVHATEKAGGGGGGRVAVILTGSDSFGGVSIEAFGDTGTSDDGAAGTVYKQTQGDGSGGGTVIVDNNGVASGQNTYAPPETLAVADELLAATLIVTNANTRLALTDHVTVDDLLVYTNTTVVLGVYTMYVNTVEHHIDDTTQSGPGGPTNAVDSYNQIVWQGADPGMVIILR